jgi:hypothetical protein
VGVGNGGGVASHHGVGVWVGVPPSGCAVVRGVGRGVAEAAGWVGGAVWTHERVGGSEGAPETVGDGLEPTVVPGGVVAGADTETGLPACAAGFETGAAAGVVAGGGVACAAAAGWTSAGSSGPSVR